MYAEKYLHLRRMCTQPMAVGEWGWASKGYCVVIPNVMAFRQSDITLHVTESLFP